MSNNSTSSAEIYHSRLGNMRIVNLNEMMSLCEGHKLWLLSSGEQGSRLNIFYTIIQGVDLSGTDLTNARFEMCEMKGAKFSKSKLDHAWFYRSDLTNASFTGTSLKKAEFLSAYCVNTSFCEAYLDETSFMYTRLLNSDFSKSRHTKTDFERADLTGSNFSGSVFHGVDFTTASNFGRDNYSKITCDLKCKITHGIEVIGVDGKKYKSNNEKLERSS